MQCRPCHSLLSLSLSHHNKKPPQTHIFYKSVDMHARAQGGTCAAYIQGVAEAGQAFWECLLEP